MIFCSYSRLAKKTGDDIEYCKDNQISHDLHDTFHLLIKPDDVADVKAGEFDEKLEAMEEVMADLLNNEAAREANIEKLKDTHEKLMKTMELMSETTAETVKMLMSVANSLV